MYFFIFLCLNTSFVGGKGGNNWTGEKRQVVNREENSKLRLKAYLQIV